MADADDYYQDYSGGPFHLKNSTKGVKGADRDPKKCSHPNAVGETCEFCGTYCRGDRMG